VNLRGRVVTPHAVLDDGIVEVEGERITAVRPAEPGDSTYRRDGWIVPGFVDLHVHGGGGSSFTTGEAAAARGAAQFHARHGTTTLLASLVTVSPAALWEAVVALGGLVEEGLIAGLHLEGPYLSLARCGAQNPAYLRDPDLDELAGLLEVGPVRMMTLAPELPGALDAVRLLVERGAVAAIGHTDATYEQTLAAVEAGASVATHLYNAMRPVHHRDPARSSRCWTRPGWSASRSPTGCTCTTGCCATPSRRPGPTGSHSSPTRSTPPACPTAPTTSAGRR
jgi:N-acetylglucosamine-6-phosphate deacetylase